MDNCNLVLLLNVAGGLGLWCVFKGGCGMSSIESTVQVAVKG